jgi:hypothetical protein
MSIFEFKPEQSLGEVRSVETSRISVRVTDTERLKRARVGRLIAIQISTDEWLIGVIDRVWRHPVEIELSHNIEAVGGKADEPPIEENGVQVSLVGTYRTREGEEHDVFTRAVAILPEINQYVFPIEDKALEGFMGILSKSTESGAGAPLKVGKYALDGKANAYLDGDKLFQRHAAVLGSTGAGKSWTIASFLEQAAKLDHANLLVFDLHGEYSSMSFARRFRIAGPNDLKKTDPNVVFLPYWLLSYDEMQSIFIDRSEQNAPNQAMALLDAITDIKKTSLKDMEKEDLLEGFTIDMPVHFGLGKLVGVLDAKNTELIPTGEVYKTGDKKDQPKTTQGPLYNRLTRFIIRLKSKINDRRYGFMYQAPKEYHEYESLHTLVEKLMGHGKRGDSVVNPGIKIIDFSEVPSDVLPVMVSLVARLVFQVQFWMDPGEYGDSRHPIALICDEAHLYLPSRREEMNSLQRRALDNFERIAKEGRKYGVGIFLVSQRPSDVSTTILSQCNNIISLRLTNKTDQGVVRQLLPESLEGVMEVLPTLDIGEAVVVGDSVLLPTRIKIQEPEHKPKSATIDFWKRWTEPKEATELVKAAENLRRQSRQQTG